MILHSKHQIHQPDPASRRSRMACTAALSLALLLGGCASLFQYEETPDPNANPALSQATWWNDFHDPMLAELINRAMLANPNISSAQAALQKARALRDVNLAANRPNLTVSGSVQRNTADEGPSNVVFRGGLDASWELDVFGANRSAVANSEAELRAAIANLRDVQLSMTAEVALAYIQLRSLQAQLDIAQRNLGSQSETLQITDWRAQAGLVTSLEVEQAQTAASQSAAQIPALQSSLNQARHSLAVLTGQTPNELEAELLATGPIPQIDAQVANVIPADSLRQRADVRAAEARISASIAAVDEARKARLPKFRLGGSLGLTALTLTGFSNGAALATQILGSAAMPILDGGASKARVRVQQAALAQTRAAYQSTLLTALKEVEDALIALHYDRERLGYLQQAATSADNAAGLAQNRYNSGLIDYQTVLQTQRTLLGAQVSVANLQADLSSGHVRLIKAMGGGW
ncbi:MAG: RND transporter [Comamonadaceae bacterium CG_4_9_14_3_um_filter_60_33]|nr:MAG: RND transporter [Comamonadaceae bacterium CG2_30_59_20]PIY29122.1 MAG: RND transporter [Comamonadaceae bacterium CG_4_10_14_3_um_filter_60_42]PJB46670.1 MAG: RND transporter [Comamonadaceae bacterium CG_4_9_14_3_um_filter_60_33]